MDGDIVGEIVMTKRPREPEARARLIGLNNVNTLKPEIEGSWRTTKGGQAVGDVEAYIYQVDIGGLMDAPLGCVQAGQSECMRRIPKDPLLTGEISLARSPWRRLHPNTEINKVSGGTREVSTHHSTQSSGKARAHLTDDKGKGRVGPTNNSKARSALDVQSE